METTAARSFNLSVDRAPSEDLRQQVSDARPVLAPYSHYRSTERKLEGARQQPPFCYMPTSTQSPTPDTGTGNRIPNDVIQGSAEDELQITIIKVGHACWFQSSRQAALKSMGVPSLTL